MVTFLSLACILIAVAIGGNQAVDQTQEAIIGRFGKYVQESIQELDSIKDQIAEHRRELSHGEEIKSSFAPLPPLEMITTTSPPPTTTTTTTAAPAPFWNPNEWRAPQVPTWTTSPPQTWTTTPPPWTTPGAHGPWNARSEQDHWSTMKPWHPDGWTPPGPAAPPPAWEGQATRPPRRGFQLLSTRNTEGNKSPPKSFDFPWGRK